jgi:hypothetical protein
MNTQPKFTDHRGQPLLKRRKRARELRPWQKLLFGFLIVGVSPILLMAAVTQMDLTVQVKGILPTGNGGTGTASTLTGIVRGGSAYTAAELSGDVTTSGSNAATVAKIDGTSVPTTTTSHQVLVTTGSAVGTWKTLGDTSAGGLAETYNTSTDTWGTIAVLSGTNSDNETPSGTIDGSNTVFTLAHTPSPAASLTCFKNNGFLIAGGADYTLATATMTFVAGAKPLTGDSLRCNYRY